LGKTRKPYDDRTDIDKIRAQWKKVSGLHNRKESSSAIVRCATASEIAANLAIQKEFESQSTFDTETVDGFLWWANGLRGKMDKLLLPLRYKGVRPAEFRRLNASAKKIHDRRNAIVHQGAFTGKTRSAEVMKEARNFIETLVGHYEPGFKL
jgi:hypothetical protein